MSDAGYGCAIRAPGRAACADTEARMLRAFPGRITTAAPERTRAAITGIRDAIVDIFCLARTNYILGLYASSFGAMASALGEVDMEIIERRKSGS